MPSGTGLTNIDCGIKEDDRWTQLFHYDVVRACRATGNAFSGAIRGTIPETLSVAMSYAMTETITEAMACTMADTMTTTMMRGTLTTVCLVTGDTMRRAILRTIRSTMNWTTV
jgi:hypothetical protein